MSTRTLLTESQIASLRTQFPELPEEYFRYLRDLGWGEADSGRIIYSGPIQPEKVYGARHQGSTIVLLGDDMQGFCLGFDRSAKKFGEVSDFDEWEPWPDGRPFTDYTGVVFE